MKKNLKYICLPLLFSMLVLSAGCNGNTAQLTPTPAQTPLTTPGGLSEFLENCKHTDADNNGFCDICNADVLAVIDLYAINDLHGKVYDTDAQPGVDEMTAWLKVNEMLNDNFILLSSGDMWQGSSESNKTRGKLVTEWMNYLDFTSLTFGNHEYDWGREMIESNEALADFPFLGINIYDNKTNSLVSYATPSVVVEREGVKIGIIGAIGDCYSSISGKMVDDVYFLTGDALTEVVKAEATRLRNEEDCKIIIYSLHDGYDRSRSGVGTISPTQLKSYYDISLSNGYVDIVFEGHTHRSYALKDTFDVWHLQDGGDNTTGVCHAVLEYNKANDTLITSTAEIVEHYTYTRTYNGDTITEDLLSKYGSEIGDINAVIATLDRNYSGDELREIAADLYYEKAVERWGDKYDIVLGGGFMSVRSPGRLASGDLTYSDLYMLFPFDNQLVLCEVSGTDLNNNFFETTNNNYFVSWGDYGEDVRTHISPNSRYYIVTDTYSSSYAPNRLTEIDFYDADVFARDLLAEYFSTLQ